MVSSGEHGVMPFRIKAELLTDQDGDPKIRALYKRSKNNNIMKKDKR